MENTNETKKPQNQPSSQVSLDQLSEEQLNALMARLALLKQQKAEERAEKEKQAQTNPPTAASETDGSQKADASPEQSDAPDTPQTPQMPSAADGIHPEPQNTVQNDSSESDSGAPIIFPDPACFDELDDAPAFTPGTDAGGITIGDLDVSEPESDADSTSTGDIMEEETVSVYQNLVKRRRRQRKLLIILASVLGVLIILLVVFVGYLTSYKPTLDNDPPSFWADLIADASPDNENSLSGNGSAPDIAPVISDNYERKQDVYNFLVLGIDRAANLSDVIMIVSYDVKNGKINVLSLPRDTYINVGANYHKLNAYFAAAYNRSASRGTDRYRDAIESMAAFLERGLCIKLDRYICMDTAGFREIVDAIGGVAMDVPFDMDYEDPEQDLYIHLKAGYQLLDGEKAEQFVRFRKAYLNGDIGRISAQKLFLTALIRQVRENLDVSTTVSLAKSVLSYVTTDLTAAEIGYFAKAAFGVDMDKIAFTTLPGGGAVNPDSGASYYVMYAENVRDIVNEQFNVYTREITEDVFLSNSKNFTSTESHISSVFLTEIADSGTISAEEVDAGEVNIPHR